MAIICFHTLLLRYLLIVTVFMYRFYLNFYIKTLIFNFLLVRALNQIF
jgi:hypothetical protein